MQKVVKPRQPYQILLQQAYHLVCGTLQVMSWPSVSTKILAAENRYTVVKRHRSILSTEETRSAPPRVAKIHVATHKSGAAKEKRKDVDTDGLQQMVEQSIGTIRKITFAQPCGLVDVVSHWFVCALGGFRILLCRSGTFSWRSG